MRSNKSRFGRLMIVTIFAFGLSNLIACATVTRTNTSTDHFAGNENSGAFLWSGTIILSHKVPDKSVPKVLASNTQRKSKTKLMAPLLGYFPPTTAYVPANNETWLEIRKDSLQIVLRRGNTAIKEIKGEGIVSIDSGDYYLQHKQKRPLWYAPDNYFTKRKLNTPPPENRLRYRRGALGRYALYATTTFPIHCAPVWTEDVGGLRVSLADLSSIYYMLPLGAHIVVR